MCKDVQPLVDVEKCRPELDDHQAMDSILVCRESFASNRVLVAEFRIHYRSYIGIYDFLRLLR